MKLLLIVFLVTGGLTMRWSGRPQVWPASHPDRSEPRSRGVAESRRETVGCLQAQTASSASPCLRGHLAVIRGDSRAW